MNLPPAADNIRHLIDYVPFLGMVAGRRNNDRPKVVTTMEHVATAVATGVILLYQSDANQDKRLDQIEASLRAITQQLITIQARMPADINQHRTSN